MHGKFHQKHENIVLFISHVWDDACAVQVRRLQTELGGHYDVVVLGYISQGDLPAVPDNVLSIFYRDEDFTVSPALMQPRGRLHQISALRFFHDYPGYSHYWMIEFDVRYGGNWADLFTELNDPTVDLYSTVVQRKMENPEWYFWPDFSTGEQVLPDESMVKIFTPVTRLSNAALCAIRAAYGLGWQGHYEAVWANAVANAGLKIEDIGGEGSFTPACRRGRHYTTTAMDPYLSPGSFVFRPSILEHEVPVNTNLLWHPVKPAALSMPIPPPPPEPTFRDAPPLQPLRLLWRRLRAVPSARAARQSSKN